MKSRFSTIPTVPVTRTPDGQWRVTCSCGELDVTRSYRSTADVIALEHEQAHVRQAGTSWR